MRWIGAGARCARPNGGLAFVLLAAAVLWTPTLATAAGFPATVSYEGDALDAAGQPLEGTFGMTFRYFAADGSELLSETVEAVTVARGEFQVELGTGETKGAYETLRAAFAEHPEVQLEVAVDGTVYEPRIGILPAGHSLKSRLVAAGQRPAEDDAAHWKHYEAPGGATAVQSGIIAPAGSRRIAPSVEGQVWRRPFTLPVVGPSISPAVRDLPIVERVAFVEAIEEVNRPRHESLFDEKGERFGTTAPKVDDHLALDSVTPGGKRTPGLILSFEGVDNVNGVLPPDTEGTVGPNHYIHVVNLAFSIYDKSGNQLTGPSNTNTLWAGFGGPCQTNNSGDAIFMYDQTADRYVLSQFAVAGGNQSVCFAVSQTPDPTGSYFLYEFVTPRFPDYYKVGIWPDPSNNAYFFGTNSGFQTQYDVFAIDRANMLAGAAARPMQFFQNFVNLMMPADVDGATNPPAGSPGLLYFFRDGGEPYFGSPPTDSLDIFEFDVDWNTPANTTLTLAESITPADGLANFNWTVCGFFVSNCIPQPGTAQGIDSASWWPMQRLVYRNFGTHETLVGTWTVDVNAVGNRAAPRWFELRDSGSGWQIHQQGTYSPDPIHRFMPSIAMDGSGNIALGYTRGDGSNFPSIWYATRDAGDPLGTLQTEAELFAGTGSQTSSAARWGDYSSMELDPADDCTFWYTNEYLATTGGAPWRTRVGTFIVPGCGGPPVPNFSVSCSPSSFTIQQGDNAVSTCTVTSTNGFNSSVALSCSGEPANVSCGFAPSSVTPPANGSANSTFTVTVGGSQATGSYNFDVQGVSGPDTRTAAISLDVIPAGSNGPQIAVYDGALGAPKCAIAGSSCDTTTLVDSRDNLSPAEPNQPNTLDGCADGTAGTYHSDESNDRIIVSTLDGGNFTEGDTVQIDATVFAWSTGAQDTADFYWAADANSPTWNLIASIVPSTGGTQTLSTQYVLPAGSMQAVRVQFRYQSTNAACSAGTYNDRDDLVFAVESASICTVDADCDDGAYCNGAETCNTGTGQCEAGTAPVCDDGAFCNGTETCNEATDSCDAGTPPACDDGAFCNGTETCNEATDSCDAGTPPVCDDGTFCNGAESCNEATDSCDPGTPPTCDDGVSCTVDSCDSGADACVNAPDDALCDDGAFCNGVETCDAVNDCQAGSNPCAPGESCNESTDICEPGGGGSSLWMSFRSTTAIPGVGNVADEDIVSYDEVTGVWTFQFDGSDLGLGSQEIDGLAILPSGDLLLSFRAAGTVGGVTFDDSDVLQFTPTSLGTTTAGTFSLYFDGSDVALTSNGEDVDGIALAADGRLIVSTQGSFSGTGASGADEDLFLFTGTLGTNTSGSFALHFDGSDVGLGGNSAEDVDAATFTAAGNLLFSTVGSFSVTGLTGDDEDVAEFDGTFGPATSGTFSLRQDLSALGIATNEDIGSLFIVE